ncbi:hypothetical protein EBR96_08260 [bacterium]|nr:hypothetical protein [bacterium]
MVVQVLAKMPQYLMSDQVTFPDPREGASDLYLMSLMLGLFTPIFLGLSLYSYKKSSRAATEIENLKSLTIRANELLSKFPENYYDSNSFNDSAPNIIGAPDPTLLTPLNDHNTVIFEIGNGLGSEESDQYHYLNVTHMDYDRITRLKAFLDALSPVRPGIENTSDNSDSRGNTARPNTPTSERTPLASSAKRSKTKGKAAPSKAAPTNNPFQADSLRFLKEGPEKTEIRRVRWWQAGSVAIYISIPMDDWERAFQDKASEADGIHSLNKGPVRAGAQYPGLKYVDGVWELKTLGKSGKYRTLVGRSSNARTVAGIRVFDVTLHYEKQASRILH